MQGNELTNTVRVIFCSCLPKTADGGSWWRRSADRTINGIVSGRWDLCDTFSGIGAETDVAAQCPPPPSVSLLSCHRPPFHESDDLSLSAALFTTFSPPLLLPVPFYCFAAEFIGFQSSVSVTQSTHILVTYHVNLCTYKTKDTRRTRDSKKIKQAKKTTKQEVDGGGESGRLENKTRKKEQKKSTILEDEDDLHATTTTETERYG